MTSSLQGHLNLVIQEESIFDNVYKDIKGLIKSRKDIITQAIEEGKGMDEEEMKAYHELFVEESESLIQKLQDMNALLKQQKENLENLKIAMRWSDSIQFWYEVENENLSKAKALIKKGNVDVDWRNPENSYQTALIKTAVNCNLEMAKLLITNKADVNIRDDIGLTAINLAYESIDITELLVANGANVDDQDRSGWTALMGACRF